MNQFVASLNCPSCGRIIEAVCPQFGETPYRYYAEVTWMFRTGTRSEMSCPICHERFYIIWYFGDD
jgi:C4-type Zn-finger protein